MTPSTLAALRILALVAAYRERFGDAATRQLVAGLKEYVSPAHKATTGLSCLVDGCDRRVYGLHLYCPMHRLRYQRHGDPTTTLPRGRKRR